MAAKKGSAIAARTDALLTIIQLQLAALPEGPKMVAGDIDASSDAFDTIQDLRQEDGWADVGMDAKVCGGKLGQLTCHAQERRQGKPF